MTAQATTLYWDAAPGTAGLGGTGTWTPSSVTWNTDPAGGVNAGTTWVDGSDAAFNGGATYTTTVSGSFSPNSIQLGTTAGNDLITGGTLTLGSATSSIVNNANTSGSARAQIINSVLGGTDITVIANASTATINAITTLGSNTSTTVNTFTGNLILGGNSTGASSSKLSEVIINGTGIMPQGAGQKILYNRDFSQIGFTAGGASGTGSYSGTFNNDFNLNNSGSGTFTSYIGSVNAACLITLSGVISGAANLNFAVGSNGGQGTLILNNNATYTGSTTMLLNSAATTAGIVRLGVNDALPTGTALVFGNSAGASSGVIDLNGKNQKIASLASAGTGVIGGITNTTGTVSTLTISGSASTSFAPATGGNTAHANIGATTITGVAGLTGSNDNIALVLDSANTGTTTLNRLAGNSYNGGTTINGGKLVVNNTSGSGTGSGTVTIGAGGALGGTGSVSGAVSSAGKIAPGNSVGTLTMTGGLSLAADSTSDFEFSNTPANDRINVTGGTLALPGTGTAKIDLIDLGSGIHNTGGTNYTLFSYNGATLSGDPTTAFTVVPPNSGGAQLATFGLVNNTIAKTIELTVVGAGNDLAWRGDGSGNGAWDINTTANWLNVGTNAASVYNNPDVVTIDETANGTGDIAIAVDAGGVAPSQVTVTNTTRSVTISGGAIGGANDKVIKNGTGTLVMTGSNTYGGGTTINAGTLAVNGDAALGAVPASPSVNITLSKNGNTSASVLRFDADTTLNVNRNIKLTQTNGGGPTINTNGFNVTIAGQILCGTVGGVNLVKSGNGILTLQGNNSTNALNGSFVNALIINGGTVNAAQDVNLGQLTKSVTMNNGAGFQFGGSFDAAGRTFTVAGGGGVIDTNGFNGTVSGAITGTGALTKSGLGNLTTKSLTTGNLTVNAGKLTVQNRATTGGNKPAYIGGTLSLDISAAMDLNDNDLVVTYGTNPSTFTDVQNLVFAGFRNAPDPSATGIVSTTGQNIGGAAILALFDGGLLGATEWPLGSGHTINSNSVIGKYTYFGDVNIDGQVTGDDYGTIDANLGTTPVAGLAWLQGDANLDGIVTGDDYGTIDANLGLGTANPLSSAAAAGSVAVPEPASVMAIGAVALLGMNRRRRRADR